jgi:sodium/hydrogen exchanger 8
MVPPLPPPSARYPPSYPPSPPEDPERAAFDISLVAGALLSAMLLTHVLRTRSCLENVLTGAGICMLLGCAFNVILYALMKMSSSNSELSLYQPTGSMTHNIIYFGLLPPIIFEAGFHMRKRKFFANFWVILGYAVLGTMFATGVTGGLIYALARPGGPLHAKTPFTLAQSMVFGSLISSTDPVATLGILKTVNATPLLHDLIFGESALNDALSIVFFNVFLKMAKAEAKAAGPPSPTGAIPPPVEPSGVQLIGPVAGEVLKSIAGSILVGICYALASAFITRKLRAQPRGKRPDAPFELDLLMLFALLAFTTSEKCEVSGVMALFFAAIVMRHYTFYNLSSSSQRSARVLFTTISETSETCLAVLLGLAFVDYFVTALDASHTPSQHVAEHVWDLPFIAAAFPVLLISRALNIFPISFLANCCRPPEERISIRMQVVMWWSGLRGAVSFALAITLPAASMVLDDEGAGGAGQPSDASWTVPIVTTTLAVVLLTNLLMAPLTGPLIRRLDLQADEARRTMATSFAMTRASMTRASDSHFGPSVSPPALSGPAGAPRVRITPGPPAAADGLSAALLPPSSAPAADGEDAAVEPKVGTSSRRPGVKAFHHAWRLVDQHYFKPLFGGRKHRGNASASIWSSTWDSEDEPGNADD